MRSNVSARILHKSVYMSKKYESTPCMVDCGNGGSAGIVPNFPICTVPMAWRGHECTMQNWRFATVIHVRSAVELHAETSESCLCADGHALSWKNSSNIFNATLIQSCRVEDLKWHQHRARVARVNGLCPELRFSVGVEADFPPLIEISAEVQNHYHCPAVNFHR